MNGRYLEITFRNGKALAAYLYLARKPDDHSVRTEDRGDGILVDYTADDRPIGIEMTAPGLVTVATINRILEQIHQSQVTPAELRPLGAA